MISEGPINQISHAREGVTIMLSSSGSCLQIKEFSGTVILVGRTSRLSLQETNRGWTSYRI